MPRIALCSLLLLLGGCTSQLPAHAPDQAWISLHTMAGNQLSADQLDGRLWPDGRYFQVTPGAHRLQVRLQFDIPGGSSGTGHGYTGGSGSRSCILSLEYANFQAGKNYQLKAGKDIRTPWLRLYDSSSNLISHGQKLRCGAY